MAGAASQTRFIIYCQVNLLSWEGRVQVMRTSYSALETYKLCPQKYKFQEIDRVPAKKSKAAVFGTHIHSSLRFMFSRDPPFPTLDEVLARFPGQFSASPAP